MKLALALAVAVPSVTLLPPAPDKLSLSLDAQAQAVEVRAYWEDFASSVYELYKTHEVLQNFAPAVPKASHATASFAPFLPSEPVSVGDTWSVDVASVLPLLRQLHPGATDKLHHAPSGAEGGYACLRAAGPRYAEVALRVHAEILLDEGDKGDEGDGGEGGMWSSSWFTPSQFAGTLLIDRETNTVAAFRIGVPARDTNVDVNIPLEDPPPGHPHAGAADIGYVPRMELVGPSLDDLARDAADLGFTDEISEDEARLALAQCFYAFAQIEWLSVEQALVRARETHRPMHIVVLFGTLDDESC